MSGGRRSRLVGPVDDPGALRKKRVLVVGVGGLGAVVLDLLARFGVGTLEFFDLDVLEEANLNRAVFLPEQVGMRKVDAMAEYLRRVDDELTFLPRFGDVTDDAFGTFNDGLKRADVLLGCVDTPHARVFLNKRAIVDGIPYIDGGARENGLDGAVLTVIPGKTPCYRCNKPGFLPPKEPERQGPSGMCYATSLPSTMGVIASLQAQEAVKLLLGMGWPAPALLYRGMDGTVQRLELERDPSCVVCGGLP